MKLLQADGRLQDISLALENQEAWQKRYRDYHID